MNDRARFSEPKPARGLLFAAGGLALAAVVWWVLAGVFSGRVPADFRYSAKLVAHDDHFDEALGTFGGSTKSNARLTLERLPSDGPEANVREVFSLLSNQTGLPTLSIERRYAIDPATWAHVDSPRADHPREGFLFAPPGVARGEGFTYWHPNYDSPARMSFVGEERLLGLTVYRYRASFDGKIDQTETLAHHVPGVGETRGVELEPRLEAWFEPRTGRLIKYEDQTEAYFYDLETGERLSPWNRFENRFAATSVAEQVELAEAQIAREFLAEVAVPAALAAAAAVAFALAFLLRRRDRRAIVLRTLPGLALAAMLAATLLSWWTVRHANESRAEIKLAADAGRLTDTLASRLSVYANTLSSARGLLYSSDEVSRDEWRRFAESLNIRRSYPGMQGLGYATLVSASRLAAHEAAVRAEGFPNYEVRPAEPARDLYSSIVFLEPFDERNRRAFGFDMLSEATRREAMTRARDRDEVAVSGKVQLVQENGEDVQPGFLAYLPVYGEGDTSTVEGRRAAIVGFAYSPFRARHFAEDVLSASDYAMRFEIFDGDGEPSENTRLFDSDPDASFARGGLVVEKVVDVFGRPWTLRFSGLAGYGLAAAERAAPAIILGLGLFLSFLIYGVLLALSRSRFVAVETLAAGLGEGERHGRLGEGERR